MQFRAFVFFVLSCAVLPDMAAQYRKQFHVEDQKNVQNITLSLKFNSGQYVIRPTQQPVLLDVYSSHNEGEFEHNFYKNYVNHTAFLKLVLTETKSESLSRSISSNFFGSEKDYIEKFWKIFLNQQKPYDLNLFFGTGNAEIQLSDLAVNKLKIKTAGSDVKVGYLKDSYNRVNMDTFMIKVDVGDVQVIKANHARSENILIDIGFGDLVLDFSDEPQTTTYINGKVGAGSLLLILPDEQIPVKLIVNNTWFCSVKFPATLIKVNENTFVNQAFQNSQENALIFNIDLSMGSLSFK